MRTTLKIVLPLIVSVASVSLLFAGYQVRNERRILRDDLARRAEILAESLQESVEHELGRGQERSLHRLVERYGQRQHLQGIAIYDTAAHFLPLTPEPKPNLPLNPPRQPKPCMTIRGQANSSVPRKPPRLKRAMRFPYTCMPCRFTGTTKSRAPWCWCMTPATLKFKSRTLCATPFWMPWCKRC